MRKDQVSPVSTMTKPSPTRQRTTSSSLHLFLFVILLSLTECSAFSHPQSRPNTSRRKFRLALRQQLNNNENDDSNANAAGSDDGLLDDLKSPIINLRKESLLFGENPATQKNNNSLRLWRQLKTLLPRVVTGARNPTTADDNPMGALYNMLLVRIPTIMAGFLYGFNKSTGHPLIIDLGGGPFECNPLIIAGVLYVILQWAKTAFTTKTLKEICKMSFCEANEETKPAAAVASLLLRDADLSTLGK